MQIHFIQNKSIHQKKKSWKGVIYSKIDMYINWVLENNEIITNYLWKWFNIDCIYSAYLNN